MKLRTFILLVIVLFVSICVTYGQAKSVLSKSGITAFASTGFVNAASFGFSPEATGIENTNALQRAVDQTGTIIVSQPGTYKIAGTIFIGSNTSLIFGNNIYLKKVDEKGTFSHVITNKGARTKTYDQNITIEGLYIIVNGMAVNKFEVAYGLQGQLAFFYIKDLRIDRFRCMDLGKVQYGIHICTFEDIIINDFIIKGDKDGVHLGRGNRFTISNGIFQTFDDAIALNAHDYSTGNPELGWIEDGVIENCHDLNDDKKLIGYFCRILAGAWIDWHSGIEVQRSDAVVSNGRIYRVQAQPDGKVYKSVTRPTHLSGSMVLDSINWGVVQTDVTYTAGVRNVVFRDIFLEKPRTGFSVHFDHDKYSRSYYPGAEIPIQEQLSFDNIRVLYDQPSVLFNIGTPVDVLTIANSSIKDNQILIHNKTAMPDCLKTRINIIGCVFNKKGAMNLLSNSAENKEILLKTSSNTELYDDFSANVLPGNGKITVDSDLTGLKKQEEVCCATNSEPEMYTPSAKPQPRINGPLVYGCRPAHPFLYRIPCQGERPIQFSVKGLPAGLKLDTSAGIISGTSPTEGEYTVQIQAVNVKGKDRREFKIVVGDKLALTPPMGWNHWYAHYNRITDQMIREAADVMISSGMADVGYQYVNIDDCWMNAPSNKDPKRVGPLRDEKGDIIPNQYFPDMKALADFIHDKGLKAGIYTSPGPLTCGGFAGAYGHEEQDARQFAAWGFDFLKYDWCSYSHIANGGSANDPKIRTWGKGSPTLEGDQKPYRQMGAILKTLDRDMVFNLCQYGNSEVWKWGAEVGGQCWRTSGDLGYELDRIFDVALKNSEHRQYSKPGEWNDPDYIQIGWIGSAKEFGIPTLSNMPAEMQYAYMSLWCMMAAPLIYSGDMSKLDELTLNVLCNPEVIEIDQDPLGECGLVIKQTEEQFIMVKNLEDGSKAVGLFNRGKVAAEVSVDWSTLQISGKQMVRDLWRQKDIGTFTDKFNAQVPSQGVVMIKIGRKK